MTLTKIMSIGLRSLKKDEVTITTEATKHAVYRATTRFKSLEAGPEIAEKIQDYKFFDQGTAGLTRRDIGLNRILVDVNLDSGTTARVVVQVGQTLPGNRQKITVITAWDVNGARTASSREEEEAFLARFQRLVTDAQRSMTLN